MSASRLVKLASNLFCFSPSRYPRHRKLISINKVNTGRRNHEFNLRHDWNSLLSDKPDLLFRRVNGEFYPPADSVVLYLKMFEKELGLKVRYGVDIGQVRAAQSQAERSYVLTDQHASEYTCRYFGGKMSHLFETCRTIVFFSSPLSALGSSWLPQGFGSLIRSDLWVPTLSKVMSPCLPTLKSTGTRQFLYWARVILLLKQLRTFWERQASFT